MVRQKLALGDFGLLASNSNVRANARPVSAHCAQPPLARYDFAQHTSASLQRLDFEIGVQPIFLSRVALVTKIDAEMLALLVEMTPLQAEGLRGVCDVMVVAAQFREYRLALEVIHAF